MVLDLPSDGSEEEEDEEDEDEDEDDAPARTKSGPDGTPCTFPAVAAMGMRLTAIGRELHTQPDRRTPTFTNPHGLESGVRQRAHRPRTIAMRTTRVKATRTRRARTRRTTTTTRRTRAKGRKTRARPPPSAPACWMTTTQRTWRSTPATLSVRKPAAWLVGVAGRG